MEGATTSHPMEPRNELIKAHSDQHPSAASQATTTATSTLAPNNVHSVSATKDDHPEPKKISYAAMVSNGRGPSKAVSADIRQVKCQVCMGQHDPYPARFSRVRGGHFMAVPKYLVEIPHKDLLTQIAATFPRMTSFIDWEKNDYHFSFASDEVLKKALDTPLVVNGFIVPTFEAPYIPWPCQKM